jgi:hypothetical protein
MSKIRLVKWTVDGNILKVSRIIGEEAIIEAEFPLVDIFPSINEMTDVQKQLVIYATKQKLMDCGASEVGNAGGKIANAKKTFADLVAGKWSGERTNSTGAVENKRVIKDAKLASQVISLEGLIVKKTLYPATFTADDQNKLDDFLLSVAK